MMIKINKNFVYFKSISLCESYKKYLWIINILFSKYKINSLNEPPAFFMPLLLTDNLQ